VYTWVVTGSRPQVLAPYTEREVHDIQAILDAFIQPGDRLIQGGARGVDAITLEHLAKRGLHTITLLPKSTQYTALRSVTRYSSEIIETNVGYWERDDMEVEQGDKVLAFPIFERKLSSKMSGTWHTWDIAVKAGKHSALIVTRPKHGPVMIGPDWPTASDALGAQLKLF